MALLAHCFFVEHNEVTGRAFVDRCADRVLSELFSYTRSAVRLSSSFTLACGKMRTADFRICGSYNG